MLQEAIDFYHGLLAECAAETHQALTEELRARRLFFGERPVCTVLRPQFYIPEQWEYLRCETEVLLRAFSKAHTACLTDAELRAQLDLEPYEEALFGLDIGFESPWTTSRLDSFFDPATLRLKFVEYNAETPAGMGYADQLSEAFLSLDILQRFEERYLVRSFITLRSLHATLMEAYRQWAAQTGRQFNPQIGIVDWQDVPTLNEHHIIREFFERRGLNTCMADPRSLEYHDGALWAGDFRIDLIYKRVLSSELIQRMGLDNPIVLALRDKAVCMSNAFSAKLMAKKASFALLSDERNAHLFSYAERAAIEAHIPWTRRISERMTDFHGQMVDLVSFVAENREQLVLKPNDEYGGKGVIIGWECTEDIWLDTLRSALTNPYVVQERVYASYEDYPSYMTGSLNISPRLVDADPYIFHGQTVAGGMTRLSSGALLNVTAGGGSVTPTLVIMKRP